MIKLQSMQMQRNMVAYKIHWPYIWRNIWDINLKGLNYIFDTACGSADPQISCGLFVYFMFNINYQPLRKHTSRHSINSCYWHGHFATRLKDKSLCAYWHLENAGTGRPARWQHTKLCSPNPVPHKRVLQFHFRWGITWIHLEIIRLKQRCQWLRR